MGWRHTCEFASHHGGRRLPPAEERLIRADEAARVVGLYLVELSSDDDAACWSWGAHSPAANIGEGERRGAPPRQVVHALVRMGAPAI